MSLEIKNLMARPLVSRDPAWLKSALNAAVALELSTLPPYLCGWFAVKDQNSDAAVWISQIAMDKMGHLGLVCNLLLSLGETPQILAAYKKIQYPGNLPGGVRPKCDNNFFPCDPRFQVQLGFNSLKDFAKMCMQIEYPEDPVPVVALLADQETFPSIGQFYDAVQDAFNNLPADFVYQKNFQVTVDELGVFVIQNYGDASRAIQLIQQQGEGSSHYPFTTQGGAELAHFYKFGQIYYGRLYKFDATTQTGGWTGNSIQIDDPYPMTPVPPGGYTGNVPQGVKSCDKIFSDMLSQLDATWSGSPNSLSDAIGSMSNLQGAITGLLLAQIKRPDGNGIYGPQFKV